MLRLTATPPFKTIAALTVVSASLITGTDSLAFEASGLGNNLVLAAHTEQTAQPALTAMSQAEASYIFNSLLFLIGGFLVMFMAAGFAMLEAGLVRTKNVADICLKNVALYALAGLLFYLCGYNLMYLNVDGGYFGHLLLWMGDDSTLLSASPDLTSTPYASHSDWFFQMVFVATAASIVSGAVAERVRLIPFLLFVAILTGLIYPVTGSWKWGGGWLDVMGFQDFAGSTLVHSVGGWAALTGVFFIGARKGRFRKDGAVQAMPGSNLPLATLGTFILWFGWFGFNGASQLAMGSAMDVSAIAKIFANTNMAAVGGVLSAMLISKARFGKFDLTMTLNGALAGLVSITAEPLTPSLGQAILIGAVGGMIVIYVVPFLDRLKIDDVVGAIPVHLACGIWGTLIVPATNNEATFLNQLIGITSIGAFVIVASSIAWFVVNKIMTVRMGEEEEYLGGDQCELGLEAYPEFGHGSQKI